MSANLVVDLHNTVDRAVSAAMTSGGNTTNSFAVGQVVDLLHADTYCNLFVAGGGGSGIIPVRVQTSDGTTSGSFTDPTSGLASFPVNLSGWGIVSGGNFYANSGLYASGNESPAAPINNAPLYCSGGLSFAAFQRPHRYARVLVGSGEFNAPIHAGFISQKRTVGGGAGFTYSPGSGTVNV